MKFYDKENKKLAVFEKESTSGFWDKHWETENFIKEVKSGKSSIFIKRATNKFLRPCAKILEGGCGRGQIVYGLKQWGYDAYGVDFAKETVKKINENFPDLKVSFQDVRNLKFPDNFFDGYWSIGVIEHFFDGYEIILKEAKRIIKPEGYFFLTFPYMSPLRKLKTKLGIYKELNKNSNKDNNFYCFILDEKEVTKDVEKYGFRLISKKPFDATKGLKNEIFFLKPVLQTVYSSHNFFKRAARLLISILFSRIAGHVILLVFKKL